MKELRDKDFDEIFKSRITEELPDFEEASWVKMEEKLRKKDRIVFYRNASIILLLLSFGFAFYLLNNQKTPTKIEIAKQPDQSKKSSGSKAGSYEKNTQKSIAFSDENQPHVDEQQTRKARIEEVSNLVIPLSARDNKPDNLQQSAIREPEQQATSGRTLLAERSNLLPTAPIVAQHQDLKVIQEENTGLSKKTRVRRRMPISLAINVGPDFNSTTSLIGGKTNLAFGVGFGIGVTKKISLQTGINFGHKNYNASAYNYTFNNPNAINTVEQVQAACKVLEIPLRTSLKVSENKKQRIAVNAGLSSYLMLKEDYVYKYHPQLNRSDRLVQISNENKHILSVIDLSITYDVKLKAKNLALGIEPYVKVPLTGIGAGDVPLKSSGLSLKLSYDFNKNQ